MFQDIGNKRISYDERRPQPSDRVVSLSDGKLMLNDKGMLPLVSEAGVGTLDDYVYLLSLDDVSFYFAVDQLEEHGTLTYRKPRDIYRKENQALRFASATAMHVAKWYDDNRVCGHCGGHMVKNSNERSVRCTSCGRLVFPVISPVVIAAVTDGDKILLTRYNDPRGYRHHSLVAGFVEAGETLEGAIVREVYEETGVKVHHFKYFGSQPWAFSQSLIMGFTCEASDPDIELNADGGNELSEAVWMKRDEIPLEDSDLSITWTMIRAFINGEVG